MTRGLGIYLAVLALVGAARLAELWWARRLAGRARARGAAPEREPAFAAMVVVHTLPFWLGPLEVVALGRPFLPLLCALAVSALAVLALLRVWVLRTLGARWNVRIVQPDAVVAEGPYRWLRHPNYAIVIAELIALPLVHTAWLTCLIVGAANAVVLWRRIAAEERVLFALPGYREAMGDKPRFIPLPSLWPSPRRGGGSAPTRRSRA